jgi:predicted transcriptional regulator
MDNLDALNFLTGSAVRWQLLVALGEDPRDFGTLREDLDVPQSTLNRNLTKLAEEGWARERTDRTYRLTALGEFLIEQFRPMEDVMTVIGRLTEYPDSFPVGEWGFDVSRLADADYISAAPNEPYAIINRVRAVFEESTTLHGINPHYNPAYIDVTVRVASKPDSEVVGLTPAHQMDLAVQDESFDASAFPEDADVEFRVWEGDIDYGLAVIDEGKVLFTGDHDGGMPGVLFETTDPEIVDWARGEFERIYNQSVLATEYT